MNGRMTKYDKYLQSLDDLKEPELPDVKLDLRGAIRYAAKKGMKVSDLSDEEKAQFVTAKTELRSA